jgi:hypothetical protein
MFTLNPYQGWTWLFNAKMLQIGRNNTLHERNYYKASLAFCFYMYYCWERELHLKLLEIVFIKKQQLGTKQAPFIHDMLIYSPDP